MRAERYYFRILAGSVLVASTRWILGARVADDYDSMNFLLGMTHYDLATFQPQFPGYPVFVALGAALIRLGLTPLGAAVAISSIGSGISTLGIAVIAWRLAGPKAALASIPLQLVAWLPWLLGSGALSDSLGVALAIASFALLLARRQHAFLGGLAGALMLGVRLSYWPLAISLGVIAFMAPPPLSSPASGGGGFGRPTSLFPSGGGGFRRPTSLPPSGGAGGNGISSTGTREGRGEGALRLLAGFGLGLALWVVPFAAVVGPSNLIQLGRVHVAGHFGQWGGSIVTRPNLWRRVGAFARDIFYDGFAPSGWALAAIAAIAIAVAIAERDRLRILPWRAVLLALAPYAAWAFLAQNVIEQPRHVLPLVEGMLLLLALLLAENPLARIAVLMLALVVSGRMIIERQRVPPAAAQAATWIATHQPAGDTLVAGTRSVRFFRAEADRLAARHPGGTPPFQVREDPWLSSLIGEMARVNRLPGSLWVTSEVDLHSGAGEEAPLPAQWKFTAGPTFCRDARIDRFQPCLSLVRLDWRPH